MLVSGILSRIEVPLYTHITVIRHILSHPVASSP